MAVVGVQARKDGRKLVKATLDLRTKKKRSGEEWLGLVLVTVALFLLLVAMFKWTEGWNQRVVRAMMQPTM